MESGPTKESVKGENALYVFNRLLRMATETELSTWKQNQVRNFMKHEEIDEILTLTDGFGRTILDNACSAGNLRLVQLLLPMGAKLGKPHVTMAIVCSENHLTILDYLLVHDHTLSTTEVVVGQEDETERMPLLNYCVKKGDDGALCVLLSYSFKSPESVSESLDQSGNTPLHFVRKEKVAAQILNRAGLDILRISNRRGQLPIDCLLERYSAMPTSNGFGNNALAPYEEELKKTITFMNTLMNHAPSNKPPISVTPPTLPRNALAATLSASEALQLPGVPSSMLLRKISDPASPRTTLRLPSRDVPKSFLSRDLLSNAVARNRAALLQEQRDILESEFAALRQQRMQQESSSIEQQQALLTLKGNNSFAIMEAATRAAQQQQQHQLPQSSSPIHKRFVAAFASECSSSIGLSPSLALLASALSNHNKNNATATHKNMMLPTILSTSDEYRLRAATAKSLYPQHFEDNELRKLLRAKYG
jgi:hypothetical protein